MTKRLLLGSLLTALLVMIPGILQAKRPKLDLKGAFVEEGQKYGMDANIDFRRFEVVTGDDGVTFILTLEHPISSLDCTEFPTGAGEGSSRELITIYIQEVRARYRSDVAVRIIPGGEVEYIPEIGSGLLVADEALSAPLSWAEDEQGRIRLELPWDLVPLNAAGQGAASAHAPSKIVEKFNEDTWADLQERYDGEFQVTYPDDVEDHPVEIRDGQLFIDGAAVEGPIGHHPDLCRYGSRKFVTDTIPNKQGRILIQR